MGSNWLIYSLGDLIDVKHGFAFKGEYMRDDIEHGPIVVAIGNFDYNGGFRFSETKLKRYTSDYPENFILQAGDMLLAMTCQTSGGEILGIPGVIPNDGLVYLHNQRLGKVVIKEPKLVCLEYLYWLFLSQDFNQFIFQRATGTKILHTSPTKILEYQTHLPPLAEQKNIARQLWQLQNKTILNHQINQTLEQMAQALFKSWFVDFDPVVDNALDAGFFAQDLDLPDVLLRLAEARQAVRKRPDFKPLPDATRQLFPAAFEECAEPSLGLGGWVPTGWQVSTTGDEFTVKGGSTPSTANPDFWEGGHIHWTSPKDLSGSQEKIMIDTERKITEAGLKRITSGLLPIETVLMSSRAPIGYLTLTKIPVAINQGYIAIPETKRLSQEYVLYWLNSSMEEIKGIAGGTTFAEISKKTFNGISIIIPSKIVVDLFTIKTKSYLHKIKLNAIERTTLENIRDTLLPKLISGELRLDNIAAELATE